MNLILQVVWTAAFDRHLWQTNPEIQKLTSTVEKSGYGCVSNSGAIKNLRFLILKSIIFQGMMGIPDEKS